LDATAGSVFAIVLVHVAGQKNSIKIRPEGGVRVCVFVCKPHAAR
jgi:hypothetical protein